jgi:hypothetical protein
VREVTACLDKVQLRQRVRYGQPCVIASPDMLPGGSKGVSFRFSQVADFTDVKLLFVGGQRGTVL